MKVQLSIRVGRDKGLKGTCRNECNHVAHGRVPLATSVPTKTFPLEIMFSPCRSRRTERRRGNRGIFRGGVTPRGRASAGAARSFQAASGVSLSSTGGAPVPCTLRHRIGTHRRGRTQGQRAPPQPHSSASAPFEPSSSSSASSPSSSSSPRVMSCASRKARITVGEVRRSGSRRSGWRSRAARKA